MPIPTSSAEVVLFAINSAVKLGASMRQAYTNNLHAKELTLPLPKVDMEVRELQMTRFFQDRPKEREATPRLQALFEKQHKENLTEEDLKEYRRFFELIFIKENQAADAAVQGDDLIHLLSFRQWHNDADAPPTGLKIVGTALVEVGVDYFTQVPGALNPNFKYAAPLQSFLQALDGVDLKQANIKEALMKQVAPKLFSAALDLTNKLAPEITSNANWQALIKQTTSSVSQDLCHRLSGLQTDDEQADTHHWGQTIFKSIAQHAGEAMLANVPALADRQQHAAYIGGAGLALMDMILDGKANGVPLKQLFSAENTDKLLQSAFKVMAEHPEMLGKNTLVADVVSELASIVSKTGFQHANLIPELARMAIEKTALNIHTLLPTEEGNGKHLLVVAVQQALTSVAQSTENGQWRPTLSGAQLLGIANSLMDEVVNRPEWVTSKVGDDTLLSQVLKVSLQAMANIPSEKRLQGESFRLVIQASLKGVALNQLLLSKLPIASAQGSSTALGYALDAVFAHVYGDAEKAQTSLSLVKGEVLSDVLEKLLGRLAGQPISVSLIDNAIELEFGTVQNKMLAGFLQSIEGIKLGDSLKDNFFQRVAPAMISQGLALVQEKAPSLSKDPHFQQMIAGASEQIATSLASRLQGQGEESWKAFGQEVMGSLVGQAGSLVMEATSEFFASNEAERSFVQSAGAALVEVVADQGLVAVFKGQALDQVVGALLGSLSSYPDAFSSKEPIKRIIADIAQAATESGIRRPGLVPELLRMSLDKAKGNLHLIWEPAGGRSLMALSLQSVLGALAQPPQDGRWRPQFNAEQISGLMNTMLEEVVRNPAWVANQVGSKTTLQQVIGEALKAMEAVPIEARLHPETAKLVMKQSVKATALRKQLLDKVQGQQTVIFYALDQLFNYLFVSGDPQVKWVATQTQVLNTVLEHFIEKLATESADIEKVNALLEKMKIEFGKVSDNMPFDSVMFLKGWLVG